MATPFKGAAAAAYRVLRGTFVSVESDLDAVEASKSYLEERRAAYEDEEAQRIYAWDAEKVLPIIQRALSGRYWTVLCLYYGEELSHKEIGEILGCKEGTARSLLSRALEKIGKLQERDFR